MRTFAKFLVAFLSLTCLADSFSGKKEMNGLSMDDFKDFYKNWKLVTTRYREDIHEMRFVYANDAAWKALSEKTSDYPDGAVFAKIGYITEKDKAFTSSLVPSGTRRYQFMVRDKQKFKETRGWGYALFDDKGLTFNGDPKANSIACAACHKIVPERGDVFSQMIETKPFMTEKKKQEVMSHMENFEKISFQSKARKTIEESFRRFVPERFANVRLVAGDLEKNAFEGTVNEILPVLSEEAARSHKPAMLLPEAKNIFALAYVDAVDSSCAKDEKRIVTMRSVLPQKIDYDPGSTMFMRVNSFCRKNQ